MNITEHQQKKQQHTEPKTFSTNNSVYVYLMLKEAVTEKTNDSN